MENEKIWIFVRKRGRLAMVKPDRRSRKRFKDLKKLMKVFSNEKEKMDSQFAT